MRVGGLRNGAPARMMPGNAFTENFNGKFQAERLNQHWFMNLDGAIGNAIL